MFENLTAQFKTSKSLEIDKCMKPKYTTTQETALIKLTAHIIRRLL